MKKLVLAALPLLALAAIVRADDPPPAAKPPAAPAKHENVVSPEAKSALEKIAKAVNGPLQKIKEATGTIVAAFPKGAQTMKFTAKAPGVVAVEAAAGGGAGTEGGRGMGGGRGVGRQVEPILGYALGLFDLADDVEHDASVEQKDGKDVVSLTTYKFGEVVERRVITTNADGLPATAVVTRYGMRAQGGGPIQKAEQVNNVNYAWTKNGDSWRLDKIDTKSDKAATSIAFTYLDAGGVSFPATWTLTFPNGVTMATKVTELVVDGKKAEIKGAEKKGEKDEGDEDDDDEKGEGHEKGGKDKK